MILDAPWQGLHGAGGGRALPTRHWLHVCGAPQPLEAVVAEGRDRSRRGLAADEIEHLLGRLLPGQTVVRAAQKAPVLRGGGLHLSLSHAPGVSALALAPFPIGIDIEAVDPDFDIATIDPDMFGRRDFAFVVGRDDGQRIERFYRIWTLKEARLKRFGRTLASDGLPGILAGADGAAALARDGRMGADMSTAWLAVSGKRYCVGLCWGAG